MSAVDALINTQTKDGHLAIVLDTTVFACIARERGGFDVRQSWSNATPEKVEARDLRYVARVDTVDAFKAIVEEQAEHRRQKEALGRHEITPELKSTPWGKPQGATFYADGITDYDTAGHGGFKLDPRLNRQVPAPYRAKGGWYEEDCEWAVLPTVFPFAFTDYERKEALRSLKNWKWREYEAVNGVVLDESESPQKAEAMFEVRHANDWLGIAVDGQYAPGLCAVTATVGGKRDGWSKGVETKVEHKVFIVPTNEYDTRKFAFVIDLEKHPLKADYEARLVEQAAPSL